MNTDLVALRCMFHNPAVPLTPEQRALIWNAAEEIEALREHYAVVEGITDAIRGIARDRDDARAERDKAIAAERDAIVVWWNELASAWAAAAVRAQTAADAAKGAT